ncbi:chymotrypsin-1-like isoform X1 [Chlorella sorokiniana]|uniref:Chymotrypsin-1-like isoform X1 n=1 Tax=Chlorella sorokiniana TaxID=3076 RepID=A0A2P6TT18_CHLSO|nr:chymotrypsin-1-like isoform X1 [Chlorella sorokiniana]|eukprot:PRW57207.1 chymotrypsin-1-like isoform X1 [Chlorella sorokiniana]
MWARAGLLAAALLLFSQGAQAIAGGIEAAPGEVPSIAVMFYETPYTGKRVWCGGTLIRPTVVLTAGHCVADGMDEMLAGVKVGVLRLDDPAAPLRNISRFIVHPDYYNSQADPDATTPGLDNDVALVLLDGPVEGVPLQRLADNSTEVEAGEALLAAGWGRVPGATAKTPNPNTLLTMELAAVDLQECKEWFAAFNQSRLGGADNLCAGSSAANGTCSGDSGGPLLLDGVQVGIVSHGLFGEAARDGAPGGCGSAGQLNAFASVAHFRPWIDGVLAAEGLL